MSQTRRLAAILAADVLGYSRLMGADEEGTHERLKAHLRELIDPKIAEHRGRIVKNTGDGLLAEFSSVVDAVRCAVEIQRGMVEREPKVPEDRQIRFRIGINVGDVIVEEHDIFGDGVNIAARLEALAEPLRLGHRPRPYRRPAPLRLPGHGRADRQEHPAAGAGLCFATQGCCRPVYSLCADPRVASPERSPCCNCDYCRGSASRRRRRVVAVARGETGFDTGGGSRNIGRAAPRRAAHVDRRAALRQSKQRSRPAIFC